MSQATMTAEKRPSKWIVSPGWDLMYVVASPLLILPVMMLLAHRVFSPEQISLVVVAFASVGHHLPGFLRCYGDRELFRRFRLRFLLAPPMLFSVAAAFVFNGLHGLELVVLFWATWHGLMQVYGFMRIYDMKRGIRDGLTARLDLFLCFMLFAAGLLCSDARVYSIMELVWLSGLPTIDPLWLTVVRTAVVSATLLSIVAFLVHELSPTRVKTGISWPKLLLALTTGLLYWSTGTLSTNMLVGVAMFEVFHAIQYYAIVWVYNRKLADRAGKKFGLIGFMFRDRWAFVGLYLAAIAAFGSIQFFSNSVHDPTIQSLLIAMLSASAILHFYYDGFIWKVRETKVQENLDIAGQGSQGWNAAVPALVHLGKWSVLLLIAGSLFLMELRARQKGPELERQILANLSTWTPQVPELQARLARQAMDEGHTERALELARQALARRPRSHEVHAVFANALRHAGRFQEAADGFQVAIRLAPDQWQNHLDLGLTLVELARWESAERSLQVASQLNPTEETMQRAWAQFHAKQGNHEEAIRCLQATLDHNPGSLATRIELVQSLSIAQQHEAAIRIAREGVERSPVSAGAQFSLGAALNQALQFSAAIAPLREAIRLDPRRADAFLQLGLALVQLNEFESAAAALRESLLLEPNRAAAHFQLGAALYHAADFRAAAEHFRTALRLDPGNANACNSLGATLAELEDWSGARDAYHQALDLNPENADAHYNLGLLYFYEGSDNQARQRFARAWELGLTPSPEIIAELGLTQPVATSRGSSTAFP